MVASMTRRQIAAVVPEIILAMPKHRPVRSLWVRVDRDARPACDRVIWRETTVGRAVRLSALGPFPDESENGNRGDDEQNGYRELRIGQSQPPQVAY